MLHFASNANPTGTSGKWRAPTIRNPSPVRAIREIIGSMPVYPGIFLDYLAPIVRSAPYVVRKLCTARWGLPSLWMEPDSGTHEYP